MLSTSGYPGSILEPGGFSERHQRPDIYNSTTKSIHVQQFQITLKQEKKRLELLFLESMNYFQTLEHNPKLSNMPTFPSQLVLQRWKVILELSNAPYHGRKVVSPAVHHHPHTIIWKATMVTSGKQIILGPPSHKSTQHLNQKPTKQVVVQSIISSACLPKKFTSPLLIT